MTPVISKPIGTLIDYPLLQTCGAVLYRGGDLILRLSTTLLHTLWVLIGSPSRLLHFWCRFIPGGERPAFCLHKTLFMAVLFHGLGLHSAARCGTRPGDFDDDEFSAIAREMTRRRLGVHCRACGGQRLEDSLPHTKGMCSVADVRPSPVQWGQRRGSGEETGRPMLALVLSTRRLAMWTRCARMV